MKTKGNLDQATRQLSRLLSIKLNRCTGVILRRIERLERGLEVIAQELARRSGD